MRYLKKYEIQIYNKIISWSMNQTDIKGNQNIVIQAVTDSTLTINVNGELKEVKMI